MRLHRCVGHAELIKAVGEHMLNQNKASGGPILNLHSASGGRLMNLTEPGGSGCAS